jgi:hypothetical protein
MKDAVGGEKEVENDGPDSGKRFEMGFESIVEYDVACLGGKAAEVAGFLVTAFEDKRCVGECVNVTVGRVNSLE